MPVTFRAYAMMSTLALMTAAGYATHTREQFYPAVIFLVDTKLCVMVIANMALVLTVLLGKVAKSLFFGRLRSGEVTSMMDKARYAVVETCLTLIIFRDEINATTISMFTALTFSKIFHWLAASRLEYVEQSQIQGGACTHLRLSSLLAVLMCGDGAFLKLAVSSSFDANGTFLPSVLIYFGFESTILATAALSVACKYVLFLVDSRSGGQWHNKSTYKFYLELAINAVRSVLYIIFFMLIFVYYGLPLHLIRDLWLSLKSLVREWKQFRRYRKLCANMHVRFPDATAEELERNPDCIICREEMHADQHAKVLPCGHVFHFYCLRSWLERQQTCPYCRAKIPDEGHEDNAVRARRRMLRNPVANNPDVPPRRVAPPPIVRPIDGQHVRAERERGDQTNRGEDRSVQDRDDGDDTDGAMARGGTSNELRQRRPFTDTKRPETVSLRNRTTPIRTGIALSRNTPTSLRRRQRGGLTTPPTSSSHGFASPSIVPILTPLPLAPPLTPTPLPSIASSTLSPHARTVDVQLRGIQEQMRLMQSQIQQLIVLNREEDTAPTPVASSTEAIKSAVPGDDDDESSKDREDDDPVRAQMRRRRLRYLRTRSEEAKRAEMADRTRTGPDPPADNERRGG